MNKPKAAILEIGSNLGKTPEEGGSVRAHYISQAIHDLPAQTYSVDVQQLGSRKVLLEWLLKNYPVIRRKHKRIFIVSHGIPIPIPTMNILRRFALPLYFDFHDDPMAQARDLGIGGQDTAFQVGYNTMQQNIALYRHVGLSSPKLRRYLPDIDTGRFMSAQNAADPDHFTTSNKQKTTGFRVCLVGSTSKRRGADILIEAAIKAKRTIPALELRLALNNIHGLGNLSDIQQLAGTYDWIEIRTDVNYKNINDFLSSSQLAVIPHPVSEYTNTVLPIKLFEYMAASKAVLSTNCTPVAKLIKQEACGFICNDNVQDLAKALIQAHKKPSELRKMGASGRKAVETQYNWHTTQNGIIDRLQGEV